MEIGRFNQYETGPSLLLPRNESSNFFSAFWWLIILAVIGLFMSVKYYRKTSAGKKQTDFLVLKIPVFGKLFQRIYLVRFTRSMNTLILGGVTIIKSLEISSEIIDNYTYKSLIKETSKEVEDGNSISSVFIKSEHVPKMVSQMMSIGEKTGKLDIVLGRITDFYTREITNIITNLMTLMEPIIMIIMGVAVGIMVAAIILPMYNLASQF